MPQKVVNDTSRVDNYKYMFSSIRQKTNELLKYHAPLHAYCRHTDLSHFRESVMDPTLRLGTAAVNSVDGVVTTEVSDLIAKALFTDMASVIDILYAQLPHSAPSSASSSSDSLNHLAATTISKKPPNLKIDVPPVHVRHHLIDGVFADRKL